MGNSCCTSATSASLVESVDLAEQIAEPVEQLGPFEHILPPDNAEERIERVRFVTGVSIEDQHVDDAVIVPRKPTLQAPMTPIANMREAESLQKSRTRIETSADVQALETWWGIGPLTPDRRMEAAMPGHVSASELELVMVKKSGNIQQLRDELPLDELCDEREKYVLWQMKFGKMCLLSLHRVTDDSMYEQILLARDGDLLHDSLKLIVTPVNLKLSVPAKGPKDADTIGTFFGSKNVHFSRPGDETCKYDIAMISVDLYSVWTLKMLLPSVAFKQGRMADYHLVSYRDNAVLGSFRAAMTPELVEIIKNL